MTMRIDVEKRTPTVEEYMSLRETTDWPPVAPEAAAKGLANSLFAVCASVDGKVVGCGRVVGDGSMYFYLQDIIVLPERQRQGIGTLITRSLLQYVLATAKAGAFVGLMAAKGKGVFYEKFGFAARPADAPGMFMLVPG
jgi:GNAT superfamily N-acetyltransferase